jgi:hypothetical protein
MSDPGLTNRLRQRSRRAGLAVGLSMALTIAVCIGSFAWIFVRAEPLFADLVGNDATAVRSATRTPTPSGDGEGNGSGGEEAAGAAADPTETREEEAEAEPTETSEPRPTATETPAQFQATHLTNPNNGVNFRTEPSLDADIIDILPESTPVQALGDSETDSDGNQWLQFRTEDGQTGWLREDAFVQI